MNVRFLNGIHGTSLKASVRDAYFLAVLRIKPIPKAALHKGEKRRRLGNVLHNLGNETKLCAGCAELILFLKRNRLREENPFQAIQIFGRITGVSPGDGCRARPTATLLRPRTEIQLLPRPAE